MKRFWIVSASVGVVANSYEEAVQEANDRFSDNDYRLGTAENVAPVSMLNELADVLDGLDAAGTTNLEQNQKILYSIANKKGFLDELGSAEWSEMYSMVEKLNTLNSRL